MHALARCFILLLPLSAWGCATECNDAPQTTAIFKTIGTSSWVPGGGAGGTGDASAPQICEGEVSVTCNGEPVQVAPYLVADWGCTYMLANPCSYKISVTHMGKTETQTVKPEEDECGAVTQTLCFFGSCDEAH